MGVQLAAVYRRPSIALVVLAAGIALSAVAAYLVAGQTQREDRLKFQSAVGDARAAIETRIHDYADVLRGVRGLFAAMNTVSRDEFRRYIQNLDLANRFPGIQVIHFSHRISAEQRPAFEAMVRGDTSVDPRGYPKFRIRPAGNRPEYVVAQYVEPLEGNERALGLDLGGDPVRLAALERTRDSGHITASGIIALALEPKKHPGFAMRLAIYRQGAPIATAAQRREAFTGVVSASFVVIDLMRGVLSEPFHREIRVQIHDAGFIDNSKGLEQPDADNLLFDSDRLRGGAAAPWDRAAAADSKLLSSVTDIDVGGRRWNLYFSARHDLSTPFDQALPWVVLAAGMTISLLLSGLIRSLATTGSRALELADRITEDLRRSEASLAAAQRMTQQLIEALPNPIYFKATDGRYLGVNKAWEAYFGTPRDAFIGKTVRDLYPNNPEIAERLQATDRALWDRPGTPQVHETSITTPDGQQREAIYYKATFTRADGSVAGLIGTIVDITQRKQAEKALRASEETLRAANDQLQTLVQSSPLAIYTRDTNGLLMSWNPAAEKMFGWKESEVLGKPLPSVPGESRAESDGLRMRLLAGETSIKYEGRRRRRDGSPIEIHASLGPLRDVSGNVSGIIAVVADITERKQAEQQQAMEHAITRVLAEAATLADAVPRIIQIICEAMGWHCGARWAWDPEAQLLRCGEMWGIDRPEVREFMAASTSGTIKLEPVGEGLVRRTFASGQPVWIADVAGVQGMLRAAMVTKAGLHGAFAFPLLLGDEVLGVMEFFHRDVRTPDDRLLRIAGSIGNQIGQYMVRQQAEERALHLAHFDELTGLPNRNMFHQRVEHALAQARRNAKALAVLFIDLDRFKNINDTLGHAAGDRALEEIAQRLRGCLREADTVGRLGGDEFVVLIESLPRPENVADVANKILEAVARPVLIEGQEFHLSASIGISTFPGDSEDLQGLMKNADISMYRAKERGKNNYQFYSAQMNVHTLERLSLESDLRHALERDEFLLHYQPKVDIRTGRVAGMEALLRWQQPARALVPPGQFISLAEETGLIVPIGDWVLRTACLRNKAWQEQGLARMRVAVNLSQRQFAQESLLEDVARALAATGLDPASLEFEITESMVMRNPEHTVKLLGGLKAMGIHLSIDDFGTGYSSLNYLKRFPLDSVKIDRSFIQDLPGDADDAAITQAIIAMAHSLRLRVIAEGVETEEQLRFLREHGCDEMQGYLFSKPLPEEEFLRLLQGIAVSGGRPALKRA